MGVGVEIGVGEHGALRHPGGAAGVLQDGDIRPGVDLGRRALTVVVEQLGEGDMLGIVWHPGDLVTSQQREQHVLRERQRRLESAHDELAHPAPLQERRHFRVQRLEAQRYHDVGFGILDLVGELVFRIEQAVIDHRAAGLEDAEEGDHELRAVGQELPHLHALADAERAEPGGGARHRVAELGIAVALAEEVHALVIGEAFDRLVEDRKQRSFGDLGVPLHVLGIFCEPQGVGHVVLFDRRGTCRC